MLSEAPPFYLINGVSLLRDHENPRQFYYQPLAPRFVTRTEGALEVPQLLLIKFRSGPRSGGFFDFDVHLGLEPEQEAGIRQELTRLAGLTEPPILSPVPVVDGSVSLMLFGTESGDVGGAGAPTFVRAIRHADKPALYGDNRAAFSVELDERGVTILDRAMRGELSPVGVVYSLDYLALRPAYHVGLTIDWDRTQDILDETFGHESLFTDLQIQDVVERLVDQRVVQFDTETFVPEDDPTVGSTLERRDAAVARVRDMITSAFFESSIDPLREPPDGWDRAAEVIKSFAPQRFSPLGVFSYKKLHYTRIDQKRLDVDFTERITIKRSMYPQGHLAGLFRTVEAGVDLGKLILQVDADDPWFARRRVKVTTRSNFTSDPVRSVHVILTYGGQVKTALLDSTRTERELDWPSVIGPDGQMVLPVDLRYEVDLEPADGGERPHRLVSGTTQILGEDAALQPRDLFAEEAIPVLTLPNFPFDRYPLVEVQLRYDDPANGIRQDDMVRITPGAPNGEWRRFLVGPPAGPVLVKLTYRAADHRDWIVPFTPLTQPQVDVADPFPQRLKVTLVSALDANTVDRAFVDLEYHDPANAQRVTDSIEVIPGQPVLPFEVARIDPTFTQVRYRISVLMKDTTLFEGPWSTTLVSRIFVRADLRGHRSVLLRSPVDFAAAGLERIEVQARAGDEAAALSFEDRFDFTAAGATAVFEFDFVDPARDAYELRIRRVFRNGLSAQRDWARFDADAVVIPAT